LLAEASDPTDAPPEHASEASKIPEEVKPEPTPTSTPTPSAPVPAPTVASTPSPAAPTPLLLSTDRILASPLAKRLALEQGIPLAKVRGTGPGGRIIRVDIESYTPEVIAAVAPPTTIAAVPTPAFTSAPIPPTSKSVSSASYTDTPVTNMRRVIASRLTESKSTIPHYYLTVEVNMDRVNKLRAVFNAAAKAAEAINGGVKDGVKAGVKLSVNDFIVKASALALQDVPEANSGWHGDFVRQ
jgi:pyruvate dehydrogenase E2 component (dihydrolipoamide acetyltransferase)